MNFVFEKMSSVPTHSILLIATTVSVLLSVSLFQIWQKFDTLSSKDVFISRAYKSGKFLLKHNGGEKDPCLLEEIEKIPTDKYFSDEKWLDFVEKPFN